MEHLQQRVTQLIQQKRSTTSLHFDQKIVTNLETDIAKLEGTEDAFATTSGAAAMLLAILSNANSGEHILASSALTNSTSTLLSRYCDSMAIEISFVDMKHRENLQHALQPNTTVILLETPTYDDLSLIDLRMIKQFANRHGLISIVDNTYATPLLQRPARYGIDLIVHSTAKYMSGSTEVSAGFICGAKPLIAAIRNSIRTDMPMGIHPHDAWLISQGLKTLSHRTKQSCQNAHLIAEFLESHSLVAQIYYPGLPSHPQHHLIGTQMLMGGRTIIFDLHATSSQINEFIDDLHACKMKASHGSKELRIRLTPGLAHIHDEIANLRQALEHLSESYVQTSEKRRTHQVSSTNRKIEQKTL